MKKLGSRIIGLRQEQNINQVSLAKQVGITKSMLSKYENDINVPKADVLGEIATLLHTSSDYLLGKIDNPAPLKKDDTWIQLREEEYQFLDSYRKLSSVNKERIQERIDCLLSMQED